MEVVKVGDAALEYECQGAGAPVLLVPPSLIIYGLAWPLFSQPALRCY